MADQEPSSSVGTGCTPRMHHAPKKVFIQKMREEEEEKRAREGGSSPASSSNSPKGSPRMSPKSPAYSSPAASPRTPGSKPDMEDLPSISSIPSVLSSSDFDFSQLQSPAIFDDNKPIDLSSPASVKHRGSKDFAFEALETLSPGSHSSDSQRSSPGSPTLRAERSSPPAKRGAGIGKNLEMAMQIDSATPDLFENKKPRLDQECEDSSGGKHSCGSGPQPSHGALAMQSSSHLDDIEGLQRQMQSLYQMPVSSTLPHTMAPHTIAPMLVTAAITSHANGTLSAQSGAGVGFRPYLPDSGLLQAAAAGRASGMTQPHFPAPSTEATHMMPLPPLQDPVGTAERMAMLSQPLHTVVTERLTQMFSKDGTDAYQVKRRSSDEVCSSDQFGERRHSASSTGSNSPTSTFNPESRGKLYPQEMDFMGAPPITLAEAQQMAYYMAQEAGISSTCGLVDGRSVHVKKEQFDHKTLDNILDKKLQPLPIPSDSTKSDEPHSCQVCGDIAAGFHCGAYVCEACKVSLRLEQSNQLRGATKPSINKEMSVVVAVVAKVSWSRGCVCLFPLCWKRLQNSGHCYRVALVRNRGENARIPCMM